MSKIKKNILLGGIKHSTNSNMNYKIEKYMHHYTFVYFKNIKNTYLSIYDIFISV